MAQNLRPLTCILVLALVSYIAVSQWPPSPSVAFRENLQNRSLSIDAFHYSGPLAIVSTYPAPKLSTLYIYYDKRYTQGRGYSEIFAYGLHFHLEAALRARNYAIRTAAVDAEHLPLLLLKRPQQSALLVLGGVLPDTVRTRTLDELPLWIHRGGIVFWAGEPFDAYYSLRSSQKLQGPDFTKWPTMYPPPGPPKASPLRRPYDPPLTYATYPTGASIALNLGFNRTTFGINLINTQLHDAAPLSTVDEHGISSVTAFAYGDGRVVFFADGSDYEVATARDVAQILWTGLWFAPFPIWTRTLNLASGDMLQLGIPEKDSTIFAFGLGTNEFPFSSFSRYAHKT